MSFSIVSASPFDVSELGSSNQMHQRNYSAAGCSNDTADGAEADNTPTIDTQAASFGAATATSAATSPSESATPLSPASCDRALYIDWMRSISVYIVVIVHIFESVRRVTRPDPMVRDKIEGSFRFVLQFGMPFFFYFGGRSASFAKVSWLRFVVLRLRRLLVPFVVAFFVVVIPTCYISRKYRPCVSRNIDGFWEFYRDYLTNRIACNGVDWLWFLPSLLVISIANQYFLAWVRFHHKCTNAPDGKWTVCGILLPFLYISGALGIMLGIAAAIRMPLFLVCLSMIPYFLYFCFVLAAPVLRRFHLMYLFYLAAPGPSIALAAYVEEKYDEGGAFDSFSGHILMLLFYNLFYVEGYIDEVFDADWKRWRNTSAVNTAFKPIALLGLITALAVGAPTTPTTTGNIFVYPLYKSTYYLCSTFVMGTWMQIILWLRYTQTFYTDVLNKIEYKFFTESSLLVYLIHWFFIDLSIVWFVQPYDLTFVQAWWIVFFSTFILCSLAYGGSLVLSLIADRVWNFVRGCCSAQGKEVAT